MGFLRYNHVMALSPSFLPILHILHERLQGLPHPWALTGSVGMTLQGMDLEPHDIDLQSDRDGAYAIQERLAEFVTHPVVLRESEWTRSHFGALEIEGVKVEIMGDMRRRLPGADAWSPALELAQLVHWVDFQSMHLPVMDLEHEQGAYAAMGRTERSEKIRQFLSRRSHEA